MRNHEKQEAFTCEMLAEFTHVLDTGETAVSKKQVFSLPSFSTDRQTNEAYISLSSAQLLNSPTGRMRPWSTMFTWLKMFSIDQLIKWDPGPSPIPLKNIRYLHEVPEDPQVEHQRFVSFPHKMASLGVSYQTHGNCATAMRVGGVSHFLP